MSDKPKVKTPDPMPVEYSGTPEERWAAQQEVARAEQDIYLTDKINQKWKLWFQAQSDDTKRAIIRFWIASAAHPDIIPSHPRAGYARAMLLIRCCADNFGYEP